MDLYQLLGVEAAAGRAELARAYRRRLRELHPDARSPAASGPEAPRDGGRLDPPPDLAAVQHAYQVLRDPGRRARYDAELRTRAAGTVRAAARRRTPAPVPVAVRMRSAPPDDLIVGPVRVDPLPPSQRPSNR